MIKLKVPTNEFCDCCTTDRLKESGCGIALPRPPRMVISGIKYQANHGHGKKLCDGIIIWHGLTAGKSLAVVELKSGAFTVKEVVEQLQAGARLAEKFVTESMPIKFGAILVKGSGMRSIDRKVLASKRIAFKGLTYPIIPYSCSESLDSKGPWRA